MGDQYKEISEFAKKNYEEFKKEALVQMKSFTDTYNEFKNEITEMVKEYINEINAFKAEVSQFVGELENEFKEYTENIAFDIGNIVGLGLRTASTFLLGGRKKIRRLKK